MHCNPLYCAKLPTENTVHSVLKLKLVDNTTVTCAVLYCASPQINLRHGMGYPNMEKTTCTACAGSMILEFAALSRLTGAVIVCVCVCVRVCVRVRALCVCTLPNAFCSSKSCLGLDCWLHLIDNCVMVKLFLSHQVILSLR